MTCDPAAGPEDANRRLALGSAGATGSFDEDGERAMRLQHSGISAPSRCRAAHRRPSVSFANAFSCNDVNRSSSCGAASAAGQPAAFLFNARADRPLRSRAFLELLVRLAPDAPLFIMGRKASACAVRRCAGASTRTRPSPASANRATRPGARCRRRSSDGTVVWGTGNFRGAGAD